MPTLAVEIDKPRLRDFCRKWKITELALFGSVVAELAGVFGRRVGGMA